MSRSITIELADPLFERLEKWTEATRCSPEEYVSRALDRSLPEISPDLPKNLKSELRRLRDTDTETLKELVSSYLPDDVHEEVQSLSDGSELVKDENRIQEFIQLGNEMTLKKSWARLILQERGVAVPMD